MSNVTQLWDACAQSIRDQVSDGVWQSTFKEARPQSITENELVLTVPNQWVKTQVEGKYNPLVIEALDEVSPNHIQLIVEVDTKNSDEMDLLADDTLIPEKAKDEVYENITEGLVKGAKDKLDPSFDVYDYVVDGAWELIYKINQLSSNDSIDKFIAIGVIVKGNTDHYEYISKSVADGLINLTIHKNIYIARRSEFLLLTRGLGGVNAPP